MAYKNIKKIDSYGATSIEYGLIAALIVILLIIALSNVGTNTNKIFCNVSSALSMPSSSCLGISDKVSKGFLPPSMGGDGSEYTAENYYVGGDENTFMAELSALNKTDPITGIYGMYDDKGNYISSYQDAMTQIAQDPGSLNLTNAGYNPVYSDNWHTATYNMMAVQTKSGQVYNLNHVFNNQSGYNAYTWALQ